MATASIGVKYRQEEDDMEIDLLLRPPRLGLARVWPGVDGAGQNSQ